MGAGKPPSRNWPEVLRRLCVEHSHVGMRAIMYAIGLAPLDWFEAQEAIKAGGAARVLPPVEPPPDMMPCFVFDGLWIYLDSTVFHCPGTLRYTVFYIRSEP